MPAWGGGRGGGGAGRAGAAADASGAGGHTGSVFRRMGLEPFDEREWAAVAAGTAAAKPAAAEAAAATPQGRAAERAEPGFSTPPAKEAADDEAIAADPACCDLHISYLRLAGGGGTVPVLEAVTESDCPKSMLATILDSVQRMRDKNVRSGSGCTVDIC